MCYSKSQLEDRDMLLISLQPTALSASRLVPSLS